ncbi:hypothetical protein EJ08DRAFT_294284 [Tothia fuscella]|uniref:Uncharacterized protein n=1 Tax=Tothia fuscella TaxID=1048955 RepID=A0A9P4P0F7_9PEZI|nr:hypothetical protein EJ08DRAFT_294284 [Tothia fuscella]
MQKMGVTGLNQNRKVKYKEEKFKREKLKRTAARDIKARERARVFGTEYIPESTLSEQDLKKKRAEEKLKAKAERKESRAKKALINEDKEAAKLQRREAKKLRREQKVENKRKTAEGIAALKAQKIATTASVLQRAQDVFAGGADEIKLGINVDGRTRTIPGVGRVTKYPTKAEKLKTKIEARAFEAGINYEEMKEKMDKEKAEKMAPEMERQTQIRTARGGLNSKQWHHYCTLAQLEGQEEAETFFLRTKKKIEERADAIANGTANGNISSTSMLDGDVKMEDAPNGMSKPEPASLAKPLSDMKKQKYAAKAVEKGMSLDVYITHHAAKKAKKEGNDGDEALALPTGGVTLPKLRQPSAAVPNGKSKANLLLAAAKSAISSNGVKEEIASTFVIDTTGDSNLKNARATTEPLGFAVDTSGDAEILTREKPALKWNPDMLGDRKVKELTKEERKARLEYMREKRMARHEAAGKIPLSKKERHKARVEKKQKQRNRLVAEIMTAKGKPKEDVSKEELEAARRAAKRVMREEKRVKRDKVIHRKKLGGGLRGQFGGSISMG